MEVKCETEVLGKATPSVYGVSRYNIQATCNFTIGTWVHTVESVQFEANKLDMSEYQPDVIWEVVHTSFETAERKYPCCPPYSVVNLIMVFNGTLDYRNEYCN